MANWRQTCEWLGIRLTLAQRRAFIYLERHGFKFCAHFGTDNAVEYAKSVRRWRKGGCKPIWA